MMSILLPAICFLAGKREHHFYLAQWPTETKIKMAQWPTVKNGTVCSGISGTISPVKVAQRLPDYPQIKIDEIIHPCKKHYHLPHTTKNLDIIFESVSLNQGNEVNYQYILEGVDKNWVETKSSQVRYPNLPSGNFDFLIKKQHADKTWSEEIVLFSVTKPMPFWEKKWFLILAFLLSFLISLLFFLFINAQQRKKQAERIKVLDLERKTLQAQINPHFIFNSLTSLQNLILKNEKQKSQTFLVQFSKLTRLALNHSTKNYIQLTDVISFLRLYMNLEKIRFADSFDYEFISDFEHDHIKIPPLLIQPFIENAILHGFADHESGGKLVVVLCKRDDRIIECSIKDNGSGRNQTLNNSNKKSLGIRLIQERLAILIDEPAIRIIDLEENGLPIGTEVRILIPYINPI